MVQLLRHLGLAARFRQRLSDSIEADVKSLDGPPARSGLHRPACLVRSLSAGRGWVGLDATSGLFAGEGHIPLACTANPTQAAPISGAVEPAEVLFDFDMSGDRIKEPPRVTKPYSEEQWARSKAGDRSRPRSAEPRCALTMGGEPTFRFDRRPLGAEWHTAAVGPTKRALADTLIRRLRDRFAPGGLLHYGQGKWYPGESLPRWAFALFWRADGVPLWKSAERIAPSTRITSPA
jgi:hypothetical protein